MTRTTPYFNVSKQRILNAVLEINPEEFELWSRDKQAIALHIASELYLLRCNPFIHPKIIKNRVYDLLDKYSSELTSFHYQFLNKKIDSFLGYIKSLNVLQDNTKTRLKQFLDANKVVDNPHILVQFSTDASGFSIETPMLVIFPENTQEIQKIVNLANELNISLVPRGGGSGLTGGAVPSMSNSVVLSLSRLKTIYQVDCENNILHVQSGVITIDAIKAASEQGMLFTVDPASKTASSLGGNIAENAGGPYAFEYGTTLDNLISYKMVLPQGNIINIRRKNHPRHKIYPENNLEYEITNESGEVLNTVELTGEDIRAPKLGKDVTNKYLGGLPGIQKEGVDGIITEASFVLHPKLKHSKTLCLEFFGSSMHNATLVIGDLIHLRNKIRQGSNEVTMTSLEEFGNKYVKAINYSKKSNRYEGDPISVLLIQLDSDNKELLESIVWTIVDITENYDNVDVLVARDPGEAAEFWEDRYKLSAISKRTGGFKLNEDVVIPWAKIPEFSDYIEFLNRYYLAFAYQNALSQTKQLTNVPDNDEFVNQEQEICKRIFNQSTTQKDPTEQELDLQIYYFFQDLIIRFPQESAQLEEIRSNLYTYKLEIANHMHAGDGNCHVNIPVHSHNEEMMNLAYEAVDSIFKKVLEIQGEISGEHGIGITKISYLSQEKINALKRYKSIQDPNNIINPEKLLQQEPSKDPYSISWNEIIQDLSDTDLNNKDKLLFSLEQIKDCTRCGKCKQVCSMYYPEEGLLQQPRNKNISLGMIISALLYTYRVANIKDKYIQGKLREITEYCNLCGKCTQVCPVKIDNASVIINLRNYLEAEGIQIHPIKSYMLNFLSKEPTRIPKVAKAAAVGQSIQNKTIHFIPAFWRRRLQNPILKGPGPDLKTRSLDNILHLQKGNIFLPDNFRQNQQAVIYFPGCGCSVFFSYIGLSAINILLQQGYAVIIPREHKCCGYPLLISGCYAAFQSNKERNEEYFKETYRKAQEQGFNVNSILTSCSTGRAAIENYQLFDDIPQEIELNDVFQFVFSHANKLLSRDQIPSQLLYHSSCHSAWFNVDQDQASQIYAESLGEFLNTEVSVSYYCCGESGLEGITLPHVYNKLRIRKRDNLKKFINENNYKGPILVSCPACKIGLSRIVKGNKLKNQVLHTLEYLNDNLYSNENIQKLTAPNKQRLIL